MESDGYKTYENPDELRKIQILSTLLMDELDRVCTELGISYQAYGGTAIGAVRHKGFIPWDDDVDISMFREDYEIFWRKHLRFFDQIFAFKTAGRTITFLQ